MMTHLIKLLILFSSPLFAQDYYSPTDKEKEPLARFPIRIESDTSSLRYELPASLNGIDIQLNLPLVETKDAVRIYAGKEAQAICMGTLQNPGCVVTHKQIPSDLAAAVRENAQRFTDNDWQLQSIQIAKEFIEAPSNEPIGFLGALKLRKQAWQIPGTRSTTPEKSSIFRQTWATQLMPWDSGSYLKMNVMFSESLNKASTSLNHTMETRWSPFHVTGLIILDREEMWFDLNFNPSLTAFTGRYGRFLPESIPLYTQGDTKIFSRKTQVLGIWQGTWIAE